MFRAAASQAATEEKPTTLYVDNTGAESSRGSSSRARGRATSPGANTRCATSLDPGTVGFGFSGLSPMVDVNMGVQSFHYA
eukprot:scaffold14562_cov133-Isochrysis_galbana.AAC.2